MRPGKADYWNTKLKNLMRLSLKTYKIQPLGCTNCQLLPRRYFSFIFLVYIADIAPCPVDLLYLPLKGTCHKDFVFYLSHMSKPERQVNQLQIVNFAQQGANYWIKYLVIIFLFSFFTFNSWILEIRKKYAIGPNTVHRGFCTYRGSW